MDRKPLQDNGGDMMDNAVIERVAVFMLERCVVIAIGCTMGTLENEEGGREREALLQL